MPERDYYSATELDELRQKEVQKLLDDPEDWSPPKVDDFLGAHAFEATLADQLQKRCRNNPQAYARILGQAQLRQLDLDREFLARRVLQGLPPVVLLQLEENSPLLRDASLSHIEIGGLAELLHLEGFLDDQAGMFKERFRRALKRKENPEKTLEAAHAQLQHLQQDLRGQLDKLETLRDSVRAQKRNDARDRRGR